MHVNVGFKAELLTTPPSLGNTTGTTSIQNTICAKKSRPK